MQQTKIIFVVFFKVIFVKNLFFFKKNQNCQNRFKECLLNTPLNQKNL